MQNFDIQLTFYDDAELVEQCDDSQTGENYMCLKQPKTKLVAYSTSPLALEITEFLDFNLLINF